MSIRARTLVASKILAEDANLLLTEPSAARIIHAIAAFPYTAQTATMDIVDNSVENGASGVSVAFESKGKTIDRIIIADNGAGIPEQIVNEVLRAGSRTDHLYGTTSLSRFGVGLKGAGFALGKKITFFARSNTNKIVRRSIDQAHIEATDRWEQEIREPTPSERKFFEDTLATLPGQGGSKTGTVVVLEDVKLKTRDLSKLRSDIVRSAGETYSKFLAGSADGEIRRLTIVVDKATVEPFDPLHRDNPGTQLIYRREKIDFDDSTSAFFTAVALPHPNTQPDEIVRRYRYHQKRQGAYVYRNGRLVRTGETFGLFSRDFHLNAFRVELEFASAADAHFNVDVAKSTIVLDDEAEAKLKGLFKDAARTADALWRQKDVLTKAEIDDLFNESNRLIGSRANLLIAAIKQKPGELRTRKPALVPTTTQPIPEHGDAPVAAPPQSGGELGEVGQAALGQPSGVAAPNLPSSRRGFAGYLRPVDNLPGAVLYRPLMDGEVGGLVVEVNVSHPFAKAVFEASGGESTSANANRSVPRRATTAMQQLLYVLGYCEFTMSDYEDGETARLFEQYRRYVSMNVTALLD
jgi:hypothetical protein